MAVNHFIWIVWHLVGWFSSENQLTKNMHTVSYFHSPNKLCFPDPVLLEVLTYPWMWLWNGMRLTGMNPEQLGAFQENDKNVTGSAQKGYLSYIDPMHMWVDKLYRWMLGDIMTAWHNLSALPGCIYETSVNCWCIIITYSTHICDIWVVFVFLW